MASERDTPDGESITRSVGGPWFEDFEVGDQFRDAPPVTITDGYGALHQAMFGDRLRLSLDAPLCERVTGSRTLLVNPALVCNLAIGQSTYASQRVLGNLFYRGLILKVPLFMGDTVSTSTRVIALRQNRAREGRSASGMVALEVVVSNQDGSEVMRFWRCPMIPCRDPNAVTGRDDSFEMLPAALAIADLVGAVPQWDLALFREAVEGPHFIDVQSGERILLETRETVTSAPELTRLTLNLAMTHRDEEESVYGRRLVYGGHTIAVAASQLSRVMPGLVTVLGWRGCDHLAPVFELDRLQSIVSLGEKRPLAAGGGLIDIGVEVFATRGREAPEPGEHVKVLDWQLVGLLA